MKARGAWLLRNGLTAALFALAWNSVPLRPLRVLVVLLHEIFHALASLATGGGVLGIEVLSHSSGLTTLAGGSPPAVYAAGYLGTALLGSLLLAAGPLARVKRFLYLGIGLLLLAGTLLAVRNPFGRAYGLAVGVLLTGLFFRQFPFSSWLTDFLGVLCLVDVLHDLAAFALAPSVNDVRLLAEGSGLPFAGLLAAWALLVLGLAAAAAVVACRSLRPGVEERRPGWGEFRLRSWRALERSEGGDPQAQGDGARNRVALVVYLSLLGAAVLLAAWSARFVLFQPWTAREWSSAAAAGDAIYLFGGRDRGGRNYDEVYRLQPRSLRLRRVGSLPSPRFGMGTAARGPLIYLLGGFDGRAASDEVLELDTRSGRLRLAGRLPGPRAFGAAVAAGPALYYLGGWDGRRQLDEVLRIGLPESGQPGEVLEARLAGRLPSPREFASALYYRERLYVLGGSDDRGGYLDQIVELDPAREPLAVRTVGRLPSSRIRCAAYADAQAMYLIGGWEGRRTDQVLAIQESASGWRVRELPPLPRPLSDIAAVGLEGEVYLIGGAHERFQRQVGLLRWDPAGGAAESLKLRSFLFW
jgi:hypothetical protein